MQSEFSNTGHDQANISQPRESNLIRLARFEDCPCNLFDGGSKHLSIVIEEQWISEAKERAVAVSYIWGESDRRPFHIGHRSGCPSEPVIIELGAEWNTDNFASRLVELCSNNSACWIDQLCIPQREDQIREALAKIPTIYRTLPVVALLPGSLCVCLPDAYRAYTDTLADASGGGAVLAETYSRLESAMHGQSCANSNGSCSWTSRIWPSQELRYSTSIRVLWADDTAAACYDMNASSKRSYPTDFRRRLKSFETLNHDQILKALSTKNAQFRTDMLQALIYALRMPRFPPGQEKQHTNIFGASFLLGQRITIPQGMQSDYPNLDGIIRMVQVCDVLANTKRSATDPRDYVISAWVDWAGYTIPHNFKSMTAWDLLGDALQRFRLLGGDISDTEVFVPSRCPAGLSSSSTSNTARWDVSANIHCNSIGDSRDLYQLFEWTRFSFVPCNQSIPLRSLKQVQRSSRQDILSFQQWSSGWNSVDVALRFEIATNFWSTRDKLRFEMKWVMPLKRSWHRPVDFESAPNMWAALALSPNLDVAAGILRRLVCDALTLDVEACQREGVDLMFTYRSLHPRSPAGFGGDLSRTVEVPCVGMVNWAKLQSARRQRKQLVSIAVPQIRQSTAAPFYEAAYTSVEPTLKCGILGIWVPIDHEVAIGRAEVYIPYQWDTDGIDALLD